MKRFSIILSLFLPICVSCVQKYVPAPDPAVDNQGITVVAAEVTDTLSGPSPYVWGNRKMGIYDSNGSVNVRYTIKSAYVGQQGKAEFYGQGLSGTMIAYFPYYEFGYDDIRGLRQPVPEVQTYCPDPLEHFRTNSILVAQADENHCFHFSYTAAPVGLLHFIFNVDLESRIRAFVITSPYAPLAGYVAIREEDIASRPVISPSYEMSISDVNEDSRSGEPLNFYALVPAGTFTGLTVAAVKFSGETVSFPIEGSYVVEKGKETSVYVVPVDNSSTTGDFDVIEGEFD